MEQDDSHEARNDATEQKKERKLREIQLTTKLIQFARNSSNNRPHRMTTEDTWLVSGPEASKVDGGSSVRNQQVDQQKEQQETSWLSEKVSAIS